MITTNINVTAEYNKNNCNVSITPICNSKSGTGCSEVELGTPVSFELEVTLKKCQKEQIILTPVGIQEKLVIDIGRHSQITYVPTLR